MSFFFAQYRTNLLTNILLPLPTHQPHHQTLFGDVMSHWVWYIQVPVSLGSTFKSTLRWIFRGKKNSLYHHLWNFYPVGPQFFLQFFQKLNVEELLPELLADQTLEELPEDFHKV